MQPLLLALLSLFFVHTAFAGTITGTVKDEKGAVLSFASISVKGSTEGAVANSKGSYQLRLAAGTYTLVCQHVGYQSASQTITITADESVVVNFQLAIQQLSMQEVIVKKGADPANEIIRQTIKKRNFYKEQVDSFTVNVYIKGLMRSRGMPDRFMGQKIDKEDMKSEGIDSLGKGILFLSESVTKVSMAKPGKIKLDVISSRQSGGGYGLDFPFFVDFYNNNVSVFASNLNPRGFISPIADGAFHYYQFKFEGSFFDGDKMVDRIRVKPKRKNEPLFDGYLQIVDGEWRIHSLELTTTSQYQLELIDTLRITQIHAPVTNEVWRTQNQVMYIAAKKFGFDFEGSFLNVYTGYDLNPGFQKKYFGRILMKYDTTAHKKDSSYWANIRPVPLEPDEKQNFVFKDSVSKMMRDSFSKRNIDSLRKHQKPVKFIDVVWKGFSRTNYSTKRYLTYNFRPLIPRVEYNTVEGLVFRLDHGISISPRKGKYHYSLWSYSRYGISNQHFNSYGVLTINSRKPGFKGKSLTLSGGKRISQFNHDNPIDPLTNALYTLLVKRNYMKIYENWFGALMYRGKLENGLNWRVQGVYEDRIPLQNTAEYSLYQKDRIFLPNHPIELADIPFNRHQALVASATVSYQPGQMYIQYPRYKMPLGSKYPTFELQYSKGIKSVLGSDVDFDKWKFSVFDNMNFKMGGEFRYKFSIGGFFNDKQVEIPDFQHFNGNLTFYNIKYLNSFQLAPYYRYSNTESFYSLAHVEHHFNGLITNKIPLLNKLKWNLVGGANTFYVNKDAYYVEVFAGIENIFKLFRVDFITAYQAEPGNNFGVRLGFGGLLGGAMRFNSND